MERFFFRVEDGESGRDGEGTLLESPEAARSSAVHLLGEVLREHGDRFWAKPDITVTVTDSAGLILWSIAAIGTTSAAVTRRRG